MAMTDLPPSAGFEELQILPRPGIGHNQPPPFDPVLQERQIQGRLTELHPDLINRKDELLAASARAPEIVDDDTAKKMTDFLGQISTFNKTAEAYRVADKEPFHRGGKTVDGFYRALTDPIAVIDTKHRRDLKKYITDKEDKARREAERRAREAQEAALRAEQEAAALAKTAAQTQAPEAVAAAVEAIDRAENREGEAIAAAKLATAAPAELSRLRGTGGSLANTSRKFVLDKVDRDNLDLSALRQHFSMAHLEVAVRAWMVANKGALESLKPEELAHVLPGATIREDRALNIR